MIMVALTRWSKRAYVLTRLTATLEKGYPKPKRNVRAEFVPGKYTFWCLQEGDSCWAQNARERKVTWQMRKFWHSSCPIFGALSFGPGNCFYQRSCALSELIIKLKLD